jgi:AraC-like DNA-binding protein
MDNILNLLLFTSACSVVIIALGYFTEKKSKAETISVSAVIFLWAVNSLFIMFEEYGYYRNYPHLLYINQPFEFFLGPLFYFRFRIMVEGKIKFNLLTMLLFVPGILAVIYFIPFILESPETKLASVGFNNYPNGYIRGIYLFILYGGAPWGIFCAILLVTQGLRTLSEKGISLIMQKKVFAAYNVIFIVAFIMLYIANITKQKTILIGILLFINCLIILFVYFERMHRDFFLAILKDSREMKYKRSMLHGIDTEAVAERIKELMELDKLYLDETLTLQTLSKALSVTPHQLSEILNTRLNTGFRSLVNTYRIDAAKKMMMEDETVRIISIAYQCGFNSKNAFNIAFQKQEGMTPTEFKENNKKNGHGL